MKNIRNIKEDTPPPVLTSPLAAKRVSRQKRATEEKQTWKGLGNHTLPLKELLLQGDLAGEEHLFLQARACQVAAGQRRMVSEAGQGGHVWSVNHCGLPE